MNARDFLRSKGYTMSDRGRFSNEQRQLLKENGYDIGPAAKAPRAPKVRVTAPAPSAVEKVVRPNRRAEKYVHVDANGKRHYVGNANACFDCGYSLMFCHCPDPKVPVGNLGYVSVRPV